MKLKLKIMNFIYLAISAAAIAFFVLKPFLSIDLKWEMTEESLSFQSDEEFKNNFGLEKAELFSNGPINIEMTLKVENKMMIDVWTTKDAVQLIDDSLIQPNLDEFTTQISPALRTVAKSAAKSSVKGTIETELQSIVGEGNDVYAKLATSGLSEADVNASVDAVFEVLTSDQPQTIDSVSAVLTTEYNKYATALESSALTVEDMKDKIQGPLESIGLVDKDGNIKDIDEVIIKLLDTMLGGGDSKGEGDSTSSEIAKKLAGPMAEENAENDLPSKIKEVLNEKITPEIKQYMVYGVQGCSGFLGIAILGWALKILQVLLKSFSKKPYIHKELIGIIGGFVTLILAVISAATIFAEKFNLLGLLSTYPLVDSIIQIIPKGISLQIVFSALIPGALVLFNFFFSIIYNITKRRFKRHYKDNRE